MDVLYDLNRLLALGRTLCLDAVRVPHTHLNAYTSDKLGDMYGEGIQKLPSCLRRTRLIGRLRLYKGNKLGNVRWGYYRPLVQS